MHGIFCFLNGRNISPHELATAVNIVSLAAGNYFITIHFMKIYFFAIHRLPNQTSVGQ